MGMGCTRVAERVWAAVGLLSEAPSQFVNAESVAQGGVLWALPALLANGLLRHARTCFQLTSGGPGAAGRRADRSAFVPEPSMPRNRPRSPLMPLLPELQLLPP